MIELEVITNGENCWPDMKFIQGKLVGIARLPMGTKNGHSTVTVKIELPNGKIVLAQTTFRLLENAMLAFRTVEDAKR